MPGERAAGRSAAARRGEARSAAHRPAAHSPRRSDPCGTSTAGLLPWLRLVLDVELDHARNELANELPLHPLPSRL